jgi:hypothetical protein
MKVVALGRKLQHAVIGPVASLLTIPAPIGLCS